MRLVAVAFTLIALALWSMPAEAGWFRDRSKVVATVSLSQQTMKLVIRDKRGRRQNHVFPVSTGKEGFETPTGTWRASWMARDHRSDTYDNAPMPYSVFYSPGYAVHGTGEVDKLGAPASHGCVRLSLAHSALFYQAVETVGMKRTQITVVE
ncbi:L,D-transpeptidase [Bauldia sp.]|uniref:L,D-transpeptidase n=1 Tax=Bauldia sp. TaxID=2575872 RepID=UPI003BAA043C